MSRIARDVDADRFGNVYVTISDPVLQGKLYKFVP